jgi:hypothetical protein
MHNTKSHGSIAFITQGGEVVRVGDTVAFGYQKTSRISTGIVTRINQFTCYIKIPVKDKEFIPQSDFRRSMRNGYRRDHSSVVKLNPPS